MDMISRRRGHGVEETSAFAKGGSKEGNLREETRKANRLLSNTQFICSKTTQGKLQFHLGMQDSGGQLLPPAAVLPAAG